MFRHGLIALCLLGFQTLTIKGEESKASTPTATPTPAPLKDTNKPEAKPTDAAKDAPKKDEKLPKSDEEVLITVTATRTKEEVRNVPQAVSIVTQKNIQNRQASTPTKMLDETTGVFVNNVAAQGSPIIRGQIGNRVVYLWDGIRINNGALFGGPNGFFNQFPVGAVDRMEVIRGPGSVQYGSDAIGGVINVMSKQPDFSPTKKIQWGGDIYGQYETNNKGGTEYTDIRVATDKIAIAGGFTRQDVDDYHGGGGDYEKLRPSGFDATGGYLNVAGKIAKHHTIEGSWIQNRRTDVDSYVQSKLNFDGEPRLFGPDERRGIAKVQYIADSISPFSEELKIYGYNQYYDASRERRVDTPTGRTPNFTNTVSLTHQDVWGLGGQNTSVWDNKHKFTYGVDYRHEKLETANQVFTTPYLRNPFDLATMTKQIGKTPDGFYDVFDAFLNMEFHPLKSLTVTGGARYERSHLNANPKPNDFLANSGFKTQDIDLNKIWHSATWSTGVVYNVRKDLDLVANVATGFRAPTFSDALSFGAPVFNSAIASVPAPSINPEKSITYEFGPRYHGSRFSASVVGYFTKLDDIAIRQTTGTVIINNQTLSAQRNVNGGRGVTKGIEAEASVKILRGLSMFGNLTYTESRNTFLNDWFRFSPPLNGTLGIRYESHDGRWWVEATERIVDRLRRPSHDDEGDAGFSLDPAYGSPTTTAAPDGFINSRLHTDYTLPGYAITNLRGGVKVWHDSRRSFDITVNLNNLFNTRYREPYSQQELVAPGFNGVIGGRFSF